jgi:hypothetical protein
MSARDVLAREYLETRAKLLEIAASLDRIDRGRGSAVDDPRMEQIRRGLDALRDKSPGRAERIQLIFSRPYHEGWRDDFGIS